MKTMIPNCSGMLKLFKVIGIICAVATVVTSVLGGWLMVKSVRYVDSSRKTMRKVEKAADLYLTQTTQKNEADD